MKKCFFSLFTVLLLTLNSNLHSQNTFWENISNQIPGDSTNNLSSALVLNRWLGFISSISKPEIYRSEFSTGTWEVLQTPSPVTAFYMLDYDQGFMCGADSMVYQTTDAGENWTYFGSLGENINDISFGYDIYNLNGYVCANNGVIGKIEDTSLVVILSGIATDFLRISSPSIDRVWLVGDSSVYYYDGNSFNNQFTSTEKLNSVYFMDEFYGWVVGDSGYIAQTSDGGNNWIPIQSPDTLKRNLNDIHLAGPYGWAVGDNGVILRTTDGGAWVIDTDWLTLNKLNTIHSTGYSVEFGPALVAGENKTALIWPLVVSVDDEPAGIDNFNLYQNYPNPFNQSTKIKYNIPSVILRHAQSDILVTLKIYDVLGNEIAMLVKEEKSAGDYEIEFNAAGLPSRIYFYQLAAGELIKTRKMVYLK